MLCLWAGHHLGPVPGYPAAGDQDLHTAQGLSVCVLCLWAGYHLGPVPGYPGAGDQDLHTAQGLSVCVLCLLAGYHLGPVPGYPAAGDRLHNVQRRCPGELSGGQPAVYRLLPRENTTGERRRSHTEAYSQVVKLSDTDSCSCLQRECCRLRHRWQTIEKQKAAMIMGWVVSKSHQLVVHVSSRSIPCRRSLY